MYGSASHWRGGSSRTAAVLLRRWVLLTRVVLPTDKHVFALSRVLCQQGVAIHVAQHPSTLDPQGRIDLLLFLFSIWGKVAACFVLVCNAAVLSTGVML